MKYRLILINPSGTLLNHKGELIESARRSVVNLQAKHRLKVVLVTYSLIDELMPLANELELSNYAGYLLSPSEEVVYNCHTQRKVRYEARNMVSYFVEKLDLLADEVIALGAEAVDMEMIQSAGLGVAMAQAEERVKAIAQYVTTSAEEGGVSHMVEKFFVRDSQAIPYSIEEVNAMLQGTLISRLGMSVSVLSHDYVEMLMPVDSWTSQPLGILHGGANLALAETVAGLGSMVNAPEGTIQVGIQVSGYHVGRAMVGDTMRAEARILHKGKSTHVWSVEIYSSKSGKLIHTARVLNSIIKLR